MKFCKISIHVESEPIWYCTAMSLPLIVRKCRCLLSNRGADRLRLLMRTRVATYYVKPKEKKGPSGQAWSLLAGVTVSITGLGIYILGMDRSRQLCTFTLIIHNFKLKKLLKHRCFIDYVHSWKVLNSVRLLSVLAIEFLSQDSRKRKLKAWSNW